MLCKNKFKLRTLNEGIINTKTKIKHKVAESEVFPLNFDAISRLRNEIMIEKEK